MKLIEGITKWFKLILCDYKYDDGYTEYLSEQPGTYVSIEDVYSNE